MPRCSEASCLLRVTLEHSRGEVPMRWIPVAVLLMAVTACSDDCSVDNQKTSLRTWTDDTYLWYREVPDVNPAQFSKATDYFAQLKTPLITASGKPKDQFHFWDSTAHWQQLSQTGVEAGYGVTWALISPSPPRKVVAAYYEPNSAAAAQNVKRGLQVLTVDGVDVVNGTGVNALNAGLFPTGLNETHTFTVLDLGSATPRTVTMISANVTSDPVQNVHTIDTPTGRVG